MRFFFAGLLAFAFALLARADNFGFETGDLSAWSVTNTPLNLLDRVDGADIVTGTAPAGWAGVLTSSTWPVGLYSPVEGRFMARLGTCATQYISGSAPGNPSCYITSIKQTLNLDAGSVLSGWAAFFNGDNIAQDHAFVTVSSATGVIATLWSAVSGGDSRDTGSPWTQWSFTALTAGTYIMEMGVTSGADNQQESDAYFDGVAVIAPSIVGTTPVTVPVPENPATLLLPTGSIAGIAGLGRLRNRI
ncbi:MAG: hypothetical protein JWM88_424 [Verrucomicrobia bacterium]|nr:hypothetical protein [Verrucomicrobiota bacterium]